MRIVLLDEPNGPRNPQRARLWSIRGCARWVALHSVLLLATSAACAGELVATVLNGAGHARSGAIVEVLGPTKIVTQTDSSGKFVVKLSRGNYVIRVRDNNMTANFEQSVGDDQVMATYRLPW